MTDDDLPVVILPDNVNIQKVFFEPSHDPLAHEHDPIVEADELLLEDELEKEFALGESALGSVFEMPRVCRNIVPATLAFLCLLFVIGKAYYALPLSARPLHYLHEALRPSGFLGLAMGFLGAGLMFASLSYLLRKTLASWQKFGDLKTWMGFHIFAGLVGPALAVFHAALVPYSVMGMLAFVGAVVIVLTGFVGRYIFIHFPHNLEGRELEFEAIRKRLAVYRHKLAELGIDPALLKVDESEAKKKRSPWLIQAVIGVIYGDRETKREYRRLRDAVFATRDLCKNSNKVLLLVRRLCRERQWLVRYQEFRKLMGAWRFLHRWLAVITLSAVVYHVVINIKFGDLFRVLSL